MDIREELYHIGTKRHSGRYPWGSGEEPTGSDFLAYVEGLIKEGISEVDIAESLHIKTSQLRIRKSLIKNQKNAEMATTALKLKNKGLSNVAIGEKLGVNESNVRKMLAPAFQERSRQMQVICDILKQNVAEKEYLDVGAGVETTLGITRSKLDMAVGLLKEEGYKLHYVEVKQGTTGKNTSMRILTAAGVPYRDVYNNPTKISLIGAYSDDGGQTLRQIEPMKHLAGNRVKIRYGDEGGADKDGVIELRRGVEDASLGSLNYSQVRIGVDGTHFMKGMAIYADKMPEGVDIIYNTNKKSGTPSSEVYKPVKNTELPFAAVVRQQHYIDKQGKEQLSVVNIVNEEGDWDKWTRTLSSQVLSKQPLSTAKRQLNMAFDHRFDEYEELSSLTNPAVKHRLMESFADDLDAAAVHLKAAAMPRQASCVILPLLTMKENEVYAPKFENGDVVVLIRHPHGGPFEIPQLVVNNKNPEGQRILKESRDAVGINPKVAGKLSGADFDGDSVLVIPNKDGYIKTAPTIAGLATFNTKEAYPHWEGMPRMSEELKQRKMGEASNLITDMTIKGATTDEITRAVKYSMVVIDAEKHYLDYKRAAIEQGISSLKQKYQNRADGGASTLISKAKSEARVDLRKDRYNTDPVTGKKIYIPDDKSFTTKDGVRVVPKTISTKMAETDDAFTLSSGTMMETVYATYANRIKALADKVRKDVLSIEPTPYSAVANTTYHKEVESLEAKLRLAFRNKPYERQAQIIANAKIKSIKDADPDLKKAEIKKLKGQILTNARIQMGAKKQNIPIEEREWEAIQAGALHKSKVSQILLNTDIDALRERALPRSAKILTPAKMSRALGMKASGYSITEIANALGISQSILADGLK